ncbi:hypothetical protein ILYODFUR_024310, partial [Ilyodon furcidens]
QQHQTNLQLEKISSMLQQASNTLSAPRADGAAASPPSQQLPYVRDVTSPNPEKFSGEVGKYLMTAPSIFILVPPCRPADCTISHIPSENQWKITLMTL